MDADNRTIEQSHSIITENIKLFDKRGCPEGGYYFTRHWHPYLELLYIEEGGMRLDLNGNEYTLRKNEVFIVNSGDLHEGSDNGSGERTHYYALLVNPMILPQIKHELAGMYVSPFLKHELVYPQHITGGGDWQDSVVSVLRRTIEIIKRGDEYNEFTVGVNLISILLEIWRSGETESKRESIYAVSTRLRRIYEYVNLNYKNCVKMGDIAAYAFMGEDNFYRFFKKYTGSTPGDYLTTFRVRRAQEMLTEQPDKPVLDVALDVGFNSPNYFTKTFRRYNGCTPTEYRLRHRDAERAEASSRA